MEVGMARLAEGLAAVGEDAPAGVHLLLENDVGAGSTIGADFTTIGQALVEARPLWGERIGVCIDTAHLWGAGHDIGTPEAAGATLAAIDAAFGLGTVRVIHLNDTTTTLGGHRDLHARLGEGIIGQAGLRALLGDARLDHATVILETPIKQREGTEDNDWDDDRTRIDFARQLVT
jgi:deoxyribonuclease IV